MSIQFHLIHNAIYTVQWKISSSRNAYRLIIIHRSKTGNDRSSRVRTTAWTVAWKTQKSAGTVGHCRQGSWYNPLRVSPIRLPSQQTRYKEKTRVSVVFPCRWKESTRRETSRISIFQVSSFFIYNTSCSFVLLKTLHTAHFFGPKLWFVLIDRDNTIKQ